MSYKNFRKHRGKKAVAVKKIDKQQDRRIRKLEKKVNGVEHKKSYFSNYNNTDGIAVELNTAATTRKMIDIAQGIQITERIGLRVKLDRVHYRARIENDNVTAQFFRMTAFKWTGDASPTLNDVFINPAPGSGVPDPSLMVYNQASITNKFLKIEKDISFWLEGSHYNAASTRVEASGTGNERSKYVHFTLPGMVQNFIDTASSDYTAGYYYIWQCTTGANTQLYDQMEYSFTDI